MGLAEMGRSKVEIRNGRVSDRTKNIMFKSQNCGACDQDLRSTKRTAKVYVTVIFEVLRC